MSFKSNLVHLPGEIIKLSTMWCMSHTKAEISISSTLFHLQSSILLLKWNTDVKLTEIAHISSPYMKKNYRLFKIFTDIHKNSLPNK